MKLLRASLLLILAALLTAPSLVWAQGDSRDPSPYSDASLVADVSSVAPGDAFDVALRLDLDRGWHAYWLNWCLTCQVNKKTALTSDDVRDAFAARGVTTVRADWTNRDLEVPAMLDRFGRSGVPLYVLYPGAGGEPILRPEVLTPQIALNPIDRTASRTASL